MNIKSCPFCTLPDERKLSFNSRAILIRDAYPISKGHSLVLPKKYVGSFFELTEFEQLELIQLLNQAKHDLDQLFKPTAYNVGINDGIAAGQTIPHLHIHLIPRYDGDQVDPRGGVRWLFPDKADYWSGRV